MLGSCLSAAITHRRYHFVDGGKLKRCEILNYLFIADWWKEISMIIMRASPPISHHHSCLFCLAYEGVAMMMCSLHHGARWMLNHGWHTHAWQGGKLTVSPNSN